MGKEITPEKVFGRVLREHRNKKGVTQEELAHECSLDRTYISLLERGLRQPTLKTILKLSKALDVKSWDMVRAVEKGMGSTSASS